MRKALSFIFLILMFISCKNIPKMELVPSSKSNIDFNNLVEESDSLNILINEYMYNGGGVALADFNNDGKEDVYFTGNNVDNALYLNQGNLKFEDVTSKSNASCSGFWCMGVSVIDINNDGWLDMHISVSGKGTSEKRKNILLINEGLNSEGVPQFKNQAAAYGLDYDGFSINSYFFDYDKDGYLDMFLINNHFTNRGNSLSKSKSKDLLESKNINVLFKNFEGKFFKDVTKSSGLLNDAFSLSASIIDINNDGWLDIFVSNDFSTSSVGYINQNNGTFKDDTANYFKHQSFSSMGVDVSDFNNDGQEDLITLDMLPRTGVRVKQMFPKSNFQLYDLFEFYGEEPQYMRNCLYVSDNGSFNEISQLANVYNTDWSWSPLFTDFDDDGFKDLYITNGFPRDLTNLDFINYRGSYESILATHQDFLDMIPRVKLSNVLFLNSKDYVFNDKTNEFGMNHTSYSYGQATADLDGDGDMDLVVNNLNDLAFLFENKISKNNFINLKLKGSKNNINALHARVKVYYDSNFQTATVNPYRGYLSSTGTILHFGIGENTLIDSLQVFWDHNQVTSIINPVLNKLHFIEKDKSKIKTTKEESNQAKLFEEVSDSIGIVFKHEENKSYDFFSDELQQRVYTNEGPDIVSGDINGNGFEDFIIGGAKGQKSFLFTQNESGFNKTELNFSDVKKEVVSLALFDFDNDLDLDLYIGYGHGGVRDPELLQDEIAINDGLGNFKLSQNILPDHREATSKVLPFDIDDDDDIDLLVTARVRPYNYPESPQTILLINEGGVYMDKTEAYLPNNGFLGMITDAELIDINKDGLNDIIIAGEWMGVEILINKKDQFVKDNTYFQENINGAWNSITVYDLDSDGDFDLVLGNQGWNNPFKVTKEKPLIMKYADFSGSGKNEPLIFSSTNGTYTPIHLRNNFLNQMQHKKKQFRNYSLYANAVLEDVLNSEELKKAKTLEIHTFSSSVFENKNSSFIQHELPVEAQFSPLFDSYVDSDFNDSKKRILLVGNDNAHEVFNGPKNGFEGALITIDSLFNFKFIDSRETGFKVPFSGKHIIKINQENEDLILISQNNQKLLVYKTNFSN